MKRIKQYCLLFVAIAIVSCNNNPEKTTTESTEPSGVKVPTEILYTIINEYPHDPKAFTEGLEYVNGNLYESSGQYGSSDVRKTDLKTGNVLQSTSMEKRYFGEGITIMNGKIYQLTYREGTGFVYDLATLKQLQTFTFNTSEGWGMTHDATSLIFDDGGNNLHFMDPNTFKETKQLSVTDEHGPVNAINELEYIKGYIYANQWQTDMIFKIDPANGHVVARADLSSIRQRTGIPQPSGAPGSPEVLNGIAYDSATNRIFITGKYWPKLFEIKLDN